jgi:hypothetical protein
VLRIRTSTRRGAGGLDGGRHKHFLAIRSPRVRVEMGSKTAVRCEPFQLFASHSTELLAQSQCLHSSPMSMAKQWDIQRAVALTGRS